MSLTTIMDALTGRTARVNLDNQLETFAVTVEKVVRASADGATFFIGTGIINLTSDGKSWLLNVRNTDDVDWVVSTLTLDFGVTDGVGDSQIEFSAGVTGGTLITAGTTIPAGNLNLGSAKLLNSEIKLGAEGSTVSGGGPELVTLIPEGVNTTIIDNGPIIIAPGTALAAAVTPPAGNTSMNVGIRIIVYRQESS